MIHTAEQAQQAAEAYLSKLNIEYAAIKLPKEEQGFKIGKTNKVADVWVVPYTYIVFEEEISFVYLNDDDLSLIYILTKHGYITE